MKGYQKLLKFFGLWSDHVNPVKFDTPPELKEFNPLKVKVGSSVRLDVLDYRENIYFCDKIVLHQISINDQTFDMVDYFLKCQNLRSKKDKLPFIRVSPDNVAILLFLDDEFGYSQDFYELVNSENSFVVTDEDVKFEYFRLNEVEIAYKSRYKTFKDDYGKVVANESENSKVTFWDFSRDAANTKEYLFVQMEENSGWFQIFKGSEILLESVQVF